MRAVIRSAAETAADIWEGFCPHPVDRQTFDRVKLVVRCEWCKKKSGWYHVSYRDGTGHSGPLH